MNTSEKIIASLLDVLLRREPLPSTLAFYLVLQLLAWAKLSKEHRIPSELQLTEDSLVVSSKKLQTTLGQLSQLESLGEDRAAFESFWSHRNEVSDATVLALLEIVYEVSNSGILDHFEITEQSYQSLGRDFDLLLVPTEVTALMIKLAGQVSGKRVYCPYDNLCIFASKATAAEAEAYIETPRASPMPRLANIFNRSSIHTCISDPIAQPSYIKDGKLEQFDITIAFPPIGYKYPIEIVDQDWFNRFSERTTSGSVLAIRHIISQSKTKAVIAVPNSILFSRGAEHSLRQELINRRLLSAVINMPPALLPSSVIPFSIIVLDLAQKTDIIRFVDGANDLFFERDGRNRSRLTNWEQLLEAFEQSTDEAIAINVPVEAVLENDSQLEVSRYLMPPAQKSAGKQLQNATTVMLKEIIEFVRPSTRIQGEGAVTAFEVSVADFPDFGYLATPQRTVKVSETGLTGKDSATFLKAGDIVIATKGSVGKLAIAPDNVPPGGQGGWLVNQSCLILRPQGQIDSRVLFMYLRSDVGQTLLKGIVSGATIPLIQLRALQDLLVIVPSARETQKITHDFDSQVEMESKIEELRQEQRRLSKAHWPIEGGDG